MLQRAVLILANLAPTPSPGNGRPAAVPPDPAVAKLAAATQVLLISLISLMGLLVMSWVLLTLFKYRWNLRSAHQASASSTSQRRSKTVKNPWIEAGRRVNAESGETRHPDDTPPDDDPSRF